MATPTILTTDQPQPSEIIDQRTMVPAPTEAPVPSPTAGDASVATEPTAENPTKPLDPRDAADVLELACVRARLASRTTIEIAVGDAWQLVGLLREVPLQKHHPPRTAREWAMFSAVVEKARQRKSELMAQGALAKQAEPEAAEWASAGTKWAASTIAVAMGYRDV